MIKYEVRKDVGVEIITKCRKWTAGELQRDYDNRSYWNNELLKSFDTLEEATEYFEQEKEYCTTEWWYGFGSIRGIHYDVLSLEEAEYDDDGEFVSGYRMDNYIVPYSEYTEDEDDED